MGDAGVVEGDFIRQAKAVLGVPAGVVGGVEHPFAAGGFVLGVGAAAALLHDGLVVGEEEHIAPLPQEGFGLLGGLHGPAVITARRVRLLELGDGGMGKDQHMAAAVQHLLEGVEKPAELLLDVGVALAVAEALEAVHLGLGADGLDGQTFGPVGGVDDQRTAGDFAPGDGPHLVQQHGPAGGLGQAGDVEPLGAALGVDENGVREVGGECALADALGAVQYGLDRGVQNAGGDGIAAHQKAPFIHALV